VTNVDFQPIPEVITPKPGVLTKMEQTMKTYTIERKECISIHDIASDQADRVINFPAESLYAIVPASYYGSHYTTHRTVESTLRAAKRQSGYSFAILDDEGNHYMDNGNGSLEIIDF